MTVTKVVRFSDRDEPTRDAEPDDYGEFVTKRTFELMEQEEPFLDKQFKFLQQTASEHCETWKESLKEVVGPVFEVVAPIKKNANLCVDSMMDTIQRAQLQNFIMGRPKKMAMVGGPAPDRTQTNVTGDSDSFRSSVDLDEKPIKWAASDILPGAYTPKGSVGTRGSLQAKPRTGIMKKDVCYSEPNQTQFLQIMRLDNEDVLDSDREEEDSSSFREEANSIRAKHKSLLDSEELHIPSGIRPESPIKLFSSQDLEEYLLGTDSILPGNDPQNPIVVDDYQHDGFESEHMVVNDFDNEASHERREESLEQEELRDQAPSSPILQDYSTVIGADQGALDFRPIERLANSCPRVPLSKSLLFSMRSRNRDIDNLLAELPTKYNFSTSGDDMSTDHSAAGSSTDSKNSGNLSVENSIDSTRDFESAQAGSVASSAQSSRRKNFKFISFRGGSDNLSTTSTQARQIRDSSLSVPALTRRSNE